jgi:hypothetical protein
MDLPLDRFEDEEVYGVLRAIKSMETEMPEDGIFSYLLNDDWEDNEIKTGIFRSLAKLGAIRNPKRSEPPFPRITFEIDPKLLDPLCDQYLRKIRLKPDNKTQKKNIIKIRSARLIPEKHLILINNGEEIMPFNARSGAADSKTFTMVEKLWDFRHEITGNKLTSKKHDIMSETNLRALCGVKTKGAFDKLIDRINLQFTERGLAIQVVNKSGYCKLVIKKG